MTTSNERGPFNKGITSATFQEFGNVEAAKELLMMSVNGPRITGRQSLIMRMLTLFLVHGLSSMLHNTIQRYFLVYMPVFVTAAFGGIGLS